MAALAPTMLAYSNCDSAARLRRRLGLDSRLGGAAGSCTGGGGRLARPRGLAEQRRDHVEHAQALGEAVRIAMAKVGAEDARAPAAYDAQAPPAGSSRRRTSA